MQTEDTHSSWRSRPSLGPAVTSPGGGDYYKYLGAEVSATDVK